MKKQKVYIDVFYYKTALSGIKTYIEERSSGKINMEGKMLNIFFHDIEKLKNRQFFINSKIDEKMDFSTTILFWKQIILPIKLLFNSAHVLICPDYVAPIFHQLENRSYTHNLFWKYPSNYPILWRSYFIKLIKLGVSNNSEIVTTSKYSKTGLKNILIIKLAIYQSSERFIFKKINKIKGLYITHWNI